MEVIKEGTKYKLKCTGSLIQTITFIHSEYKDGIAPQFIDGTTHEDLLEVLIDRLKTLNSKKHYKENDEAIRSLEVAKLWLNKKNRKKLENKFKRLKDNSTRLEAHRDLRTPIVINEQGEASHPIEELKNFNWSLNDDEKL